MGKRKKWAWMALLLSLTMIAAACGGDDDDDGDTTGDTTGDTGAEPTGETTGGGDLSGTIVVSGSSTVLPISSLVAEEFNATAPNVAISVDGPGTGDGFELFCNGETDISDASRPIDEDEVAACEGNGINYQELEVGIDGIAVMTNPANDAVTCLTPGDLYALMGPESEGFGTWAAANDLATQVGGNGGLPDVPLEITAPGEESGTYDSFIEILGFEDIAIEDGIPEEEAAALRRDYQASPDDNVIIQAMEGSDTPLGFVGFAYAAEAGDAVRLLEVDAGSGCVGPTEETIADGSYPISRSLFIYVNTDKAAENAALSAFVDFYVSEASLTELVGAVGYVPIPADRIAATQSAWEGVGV